MNNSKFKYFAMAVAIVAVLAILKNSLIKQDPNEIARKLNDRAIASAAKLMILPGEEPVVATVKEAEALRKEQPFYANVANGDQLLLFPKSRQAVIYSPSRNIIVNAGSLTIAGEKKPTPATKK